LPVSTDTIKALREQTGAGVMDCKRALEEAQGDLAKATEILRDQGIAIAAKKASRRTAEGVIESYVHSGSRIGAMVELNCETDFVARLPEFRNLAHNLAMQVAAMAPLYISRADLSPGASEEGEGLVFLEQPFIKDESRTVQDLIRELISTVGENIRVRRFARFALGSSSAQICSPDTNESS